MILTEAEAATKLCPENFPRCQGSACMAWRWGEVELFEYGTPLPEGATPADPSWQKHGEAYIGPHGLTQAWRRPLPRKGYCGKVGEP